MQALVSAKIDVVFFLIALNSDAIKRLLDSPDLHLLGFESAEGLTLLAPYLEVVNIPASTYRVSPREITTVAAKAVLSASTELTDAEVYEIAVKLSQHMHDLLKTIPLSMTKGNDTLPISITHSMTGFVMPAQGAVVGDDLIRGVAGFSYSANEAMSELV